MTQQVVFLVWDGLQGLPPKVIGRHGKRENALRQLRFIRNAALATGMGFEEIMNRSFLEETVRGTPERIDG